MCIRDRAYTSADLDYNDSASRSQMEQRDPAARPAVSGAVEGMDGYDVVFLGYPIWNGRPPRIISTFLESYDFTGKTIVPFCTSGGSGFSDSGLHELVSGATWAEGRRLNSASQDAVTQWVDGLQLSFKEETAMKLTVTNGNTSVVFKLNDSPAARSLAGQLPLTLDVRPFSFNEQTFYPPTALDTTCLLYTSTPRTRCSRASSPPMRSTVRPSTAFTPTSSISPPTTRRPTAAPSS